MVILFLQHLFVAAKAGVDLFDRVDALFAQVFEHLLIDAGQRHGVVDRTVVVEGRDFQMLVDGIQLIVVQPREQRLRHGQRINIGVVERNARALPCPANKQHIKAVRVVRHQHMVAAEFLELTNGFLRRGGVGHHAVVDAGQLHHPGRNGPARVDKGTEFLFFIDAAIFHKNCADLGQAVVVGVQTGGLGIEHNKAAADRLLGLAVHRRHHIVDKVRFRAVDQLEIRVLLVDIVGREHRLRVSLADAVVGDGDGAVAHAVRKAHDLAGVAEAVHRARLGVQVQLNALLSLGRRILPRFALDLQDVIRQQNVVALVLVIGIVAAHDQRRAGFEAFPLGHVLVVVAEDLEIDRTVIVCNGREIDLAAAALDLGGEHIAPDRDLAAVAQIVERAQVGRFERLAVEQLGRRGGQGQAVDRKRRDLLFCLELNGRGLFGHTALQGLFVHLGGHVLHAHDGQRAGALLDQFRQMARKVDAFKDGAPGVDAHGETVRLKHNGLVFVQKTVDRHALAFELFDQHGDGFRRDGAVRKIIFQLQLIPGKNGLQGRQKTPAQRRVQRSGAAQADDDGAGGAEQLHTLDHDPAEGAVELGVGRKLRPDLGHIRFQRNSFSGTAGFTAYRSRR